MNGVGRVLCPVDLRQPSHVALGFAAMLAEQFHSVLDVVYVPEGEDARTAGLFAPRVRAVEKLMVTHNVTEDLKSLVAGCAHGVPFTIAVRSGRVLRVLLAEARQRQSDLIVVGACNPSWFRVTANLADVLAADAPCPVITVPDGPLPARLARILLHVDFSEATDAAVEWTALLARRFDASVDVMHGEGGLTSSSSELGQIQSRFARSGVHATMRAAHDVSVLADAARDGADHPFQLIVVGAERRGAGRLDALFLERLRRRALVPVLSIVATTDPQPMRSLNPLTWFPELLPSSVAAVPNPLPG